MVGTVVIAVVNSIAVGIDCRTKGRTAGRTGRRNFGTGGPVQGTLGKSLRTPGWVIGAQGKLCGTDGHRLGADGRVFRTLSNLTYGWGTIRTISYNLGT